MNVTYRLQARYRAPTERLHWTFTHDVYRYPTGYDTIYPTSYDTIYDTGYAHTDEHRRAQTSTGTSTDEHRRAQTSTQACTGTRAQAREHRHESTGTQVVTSGTGSLYPQRGAQARSG